LFCYVYFFVHPSFFRFLSHIPFYCMFLFLTNSLTFHFTISHVCVSPLFQFLLVLSFLLSFLSSSASYFRFSLSLPLYSLMYLPCICIFTYSILRFRLFSS
jgi:hypothetical protein